MLLKPLRLRVLPFTSLHISCTSNGLRKALKKKLEEAGAERRSDFQNWAEFENRGFKKPEYMTCWIIEQYGNPKSVLKKDTINVKYEKYTGTNAELSYLRQAVTKPNEVLVKVHASSLNPIDIKMCQGYGHTLINFRRNMVVGSVDKFVKVGHQTEFPLVLGRDFSGTVVDVGTGVHDILPGDEVFGAQEIHRVGSLADYICVSLKSLAHKPTTLSHVEAASLPYVALTTTSALQQFAETAEGKRVLLLGGSGGIGTFAIQYLRAKGAYIGVTCKSSAFKLCTSLGADQCFDYTATNHEHLLMQEPRFDFIFDIVGTRSPEWAKYFLCTNGTYSSLVSPILNNTDNFGLVLGLSASVTSYLKSYIYGSNKFLWPSFEPDRQRLLEIAKMVDSGSINPVIQKVFDYSDVPSAFEMVATGKCKGKVVVNVSGLPEATAKENTDKIIHL